MAGNASALSDSQKQALAIFIAGRPFKLPVEKALRLLAVAFSLAVAVGSGVTPANVGAMFAVADAVIVASWLKRDGVWWNEVDPDRLRPIDADLQVPNTAKFHAHTGWKPEIPFDKTLEDLLSYWRERV